MSTSGKGIFKRNIFGHYLILRRLLMAMIGVVTYPMYSVFNRTHIKGLDVLGDLPGDRVLFVSNHQTYFSDVILIYHAFAVQRFGKKSLGFPWYLIKLRLNTYYVAAEETMKQGIVPRIFAYTGALQIKRTWRESGQNIDRPVDPSDIEKINKALASGWVITFPQGTTKPFEKGRKGTAHIIKNTKPVVVPVTVKGLRRAFDKKGLRLKKTGMDLELTFKSPLQIDYSAEADEIISVIMDAIEQSEQYNKVPPVREVNKMT